jgi:hypothetical protein
MHNLTELHEALARVVLVDRELSDVLTAITGVARRAMPGTEAASITLIRGDNPFTAAHDGQIALDADELQYERGYGPCVDAARAGQMFLVDDMRIEQRWPDYAQHAAAHGVLSSLSVPLPFQGATIGALNTYAGRPQGLRRAGCCLGPGGCRLGSARDRQRRSCGPQQRRSPSPAHCDDVSRLHRPGERYFDGAAQDYRGRGVHYAGPRLPTNQQQAARRGCRARPDWRAAQSRLTVSTFLSDPSPKDLG